MKPTRGFFEIGIINGKSKLNLGTLWRSANIMGAAGIFTIGKRYPKRQSSDTMDTPKHIPLREYDEFEDFYNSIPRDTKLIGIEFVKSSKSLFEFKHPERATYLLGAEDWGTHLDVLDCCDDIVKIPFDKNCLNVSTAGSIVMYDRIFKMSKQ